MEKTPNTLFGICRKAGYCVPDCGLCAHINPFQSPSYKASNQAARYKKKKLAGVLLGPDTKGIQIGYKDPLRPVKDGYGFFGTITVDEDHKFVQCHICGFFFKLLGQHLTEHQINQKDYKKKYGLSVGAPLMTGDTVQEWKEKRPYNYTKQHKIQAQKAVKLATAAQRSSKLIGKATLPLEYYNRFGICPDQVIDKYLHLKEILGRHPSYREVSKEYNNGTARLIIKALSCSNWIDVANRIDELDATPLRSEKISSKDLDVIRNRSNFKPKNESQIDKFNRRSAFKKALLSPASPYSYQS